MYKLEIKLKQHTPLIHFQHNQEGATLRASEVKPKLDKYIIRKLKESGEYNDGVQKGWIKTKNGKEWLDYKMRIDDSPENVYSYKTNDKRLYTSINKDNDKKHNKSILYVTAGQLLKDYNPKTQSLVIKEGNNEYIAKRRDSDSRVIYALTSYPCFFANIDTDITDMNEYRKITFAKNCFKMTILVKNNSLHKILNNGETLSSFFMNHNFGTRQSKGFGSFFIDEDDPLYVAPQADYSFNVSTASDEKGFKMLFDHIDLFIRSIRSGINIKDRNNNTWFYFKSLAFMYCKDVLHAEWDKRRVKKEFYLTDTPQRKSDSRIQRSLSAQQNKYPKDEEHDILFFDHPDGYDIRDLLGFSTNETWLSYKDLIEKKVAIIKNEKLVFPQKQDSTPVDRMRSPLLIKPVFDTNIGFRVFLIFQDKEVGMDEFKRQKKICFISKKEHSRFMLPLPEQFSMDSYFNYIFNKLCFNIENHVNKTYHGKPEYDKLASIFSQLKDSIR